MHFASDNCGPVHPSVMEALATANTGHMASYGADDITAQVQDQIRTLFDAPEARVFLVTTGTAANALALAACTSPWDAVFCSDIAHIHLDEAGAPEFYGGGTKLVPVPAPDGRMTPAGLKAEMEKWGDSFHNPQIGALSLTNLTECGTLYTPDQIAALARVAKARDASVHLDGARFANALAALGCAPADLTCKAGVDVLSLGGTKNGLMGAEAVVIFDPKLAQTLELRRKRGGHLLSKHRYVAAQMQAYLADNLWLRLAERSNAAAARLAAGLEAAPGVSLAHLVDGNMIFVQMPKATHDHMTQCGATYFLTEDNGAQVTARLVCDWSTSDSAVDQFLETLSQAAR